MAATERKGAEAAQIGSDAQNQDSTPQTKDLNTTEKPSSHSEEAKDEDSSMSSEHAVTPEAQPDQHDVEKGMETKTEGPQSPEQGRSKGKVAIIMFALCMAVFLAALDVTIITTALPTISEHFHSEAGYTWIGSAFLLANAASVCSWGKVSDIFGRKPMLLAANVIFMAGSLIAALSTSIGMLIAARAIQGVGGGGLVILVNICIGDLFSLRNRGAFYGVIGGVWAIASSIGPVIGGAFTEYVSWRWCFYINLPLDGIAFCILLFFLDLKHPRTPIMEGLKAIDWIGSLTIVGGTLMFLLGLQDGGVSFPWESATIICLLVFGVVTWVLFAIWEFKFALHPVMPMSIFKKRTNCATLVLVFLHGFVFISGSYYLPLYFQAVRGASPILSGVYVLPTALALACTSIGTGVFVRKVGAFLPPIYFGVTMLTIGFALYTNIDAKSSWPKLILFQIVSGFGIGPLFQAPIIALQAHIRPQDIGTATATLGFTRQLATSTSVVIGQVVFQNQMKKNAASLARVLGPQLASQLGGGNAGANTKLIDKLPPHEKSIYRRDFANSLQPMWIMYACFAGASIIAAIFIQRKQLNQKHEETKTGMEAEKQKAAELQAEREARRASKRRSHQQSPDARPPRLSTSDPHANALAEQESEKESA